VPICGGAKRQVAGALVGLSEFDVCRMTLKHQDLDELVEERRSCRLQLTAVDHDTDVRKITRQVRDLLNPCPQEVARAEAPGC
jgi:hypothetical protein